MTGSTRKGRWHAGTKGSSSLPSPVEKRAKGSLGTSCCKGWRAAPVCGVLLLIPASLQAVPVCHQPGGWLSGLTVGMRSRTRPLLLHLSLPGETDNAPRSQGRSLLFLRASSSQLYQPAQLGEGSGSFPSSFSRARGVCLDSLRKKRGLRFRLLSRQGDCREVKP